jgi:nucleotide-binding universal stress UspA family protein
LKGFYSFFTEIVEGEVMKILVGIDGSGHSYDTLKYAISEAKSKKAKLTAVLSRVEEKTSEGAIQDRGIIERVEKIMQDEGIEPDAHLLVRGFSPAVDIVKFAEENNYDQIIVGSHGLSGITRILLGSVADEVVHKAHCPVTVFRR